MLTIELNGRMGNNMFQYAMVRSIAEMRGFDFSIDRQAWLCYKLFDLYLGVDEVVVNNTYEEKDRFDEDIFRVPDFTKFIGYFQSEKYFNTEKVREWFTPIIDVVGDFDNVCYINFRGGDYNVPPWDVIQLGQGYYDHAKEKILSINPNLRFVVVTDDAPEATKRFPGLEVICDTPEHDFTLLTKAKYLIISNSTFSWWAGWLNRNNVVIAPNGWFSYNRPYNDFSPPGIRTDEFIWI